MAGLAWEDLEWVGGGSRPGKRIKPITNIAYLADSLGPAHSGPILNNVVSVNGTELVVTTASAMSSAWGYYQLVGFGEVGANQRCRVTAVVAAGGQATLIGDAPWPATVSKAANAPDIRALQARNLRGGWLAIAMALTGKYPTVGMNSVQPGLSLAGGLTAYTAAIRPVRPSHLMTQLGTNSLSTVSATDVIAQYKSLCEMARADGTQVFILSIPPATMESGLYGTNEARAEVNAALAEWAATQADVFFIDVATPLMNAEGSLKAEYSTDTSGVHLTDAAYYASVAPVLEIFNKNVVPHTVVNNRVADPGYTSTKAIDTYPVMANRSGIMPSGGTLGPASAMAAAGTLISSVENGVWTLEYTGGAPNTYCLVRPAPTDAAITAAVAQKEWCSVDVRIEKGSSALELLNYFNYNGTGLSVQGSSGISAWNDYSNGQWHTLRGLPQLLKAGDTLSSRMDFFVRTLDSGEFKIQFRNPAFWTEPVA